MRCIYEYKNYVKITFLDKGQNCSSQDPSDNKNLYYVHNAFRFSEMGRNGKHFRNVL